MALKNLNIGKANPDVTVNDNFINALFVEASGRNATAKELARFRGLKVKDVANLVLGAEKSPFFKAGKGETKMETAARQRAKAQKTGIPATPELLRANKGNDDSGKNTTIQVPGSKKTIKLPDALANNPYFKQLDPEQQALIAYNWQIQKSQNEETKKLFADALDEASKQADPYWREQFNIAKDEVGRTIAGYQADLTEREAELERRKTEIQQDLSSESQFMDAEKQATLATQAQNYEIEAEQLREQMAAQGISSSTISSRAKARKAQANQGVVEGIERRATRDKNILQTTASRNLEDVAANLLNIRRKTTEAITGIVRGAEAKLGSAEAGTISGVSGYLSGNITGSMAEQKAQDILTRAQTLAKSRGAF